MLLNCLSLVIERGDRYQNGLHAVNRGAKICGCVGPRALCHSDER